MAGSVPLSQAVEAKSTDPFKEANELKEKRLALESSGKLSKSKSAQVNQLKVMEDQARAKARAEVARAEEKAAKLETEKTASASAGSGAFTDRLSNVTGIGQ